jgi:hypothetical protein
MQFVSYAAAAVACIFDRLITAGCSHLKFVVCCTSILFCTADVLYILVHTVAFVRQVGNIAGKTAQGKLGEALQDTAKYVKVRQTADAENIAKFTDGLKKSR